MKLPKIPKHTVRYSKGFFEAYSLEKKKVVRRFKSYKELIFWATYWPSAYKIGYNPPDITPMSFMLTITPEMILPTGYKPKTKKEFKTLVAKVKKEMEEAFLSIVVYSNCLKMKNENANRS